MIIIIISIISSQQLCEKKHTAQHTKSLSLSLTRWGVITSRVRPERPPLNVVIIENKFMSVFFWWQYIKFILCS